MVTAWLILAARVSAEGVDAVLWVDPTSGNNTNDGSTESTALSTISAEKIKAAEMGEDSNVIAYLKGGTY